MLCEVRSLGLSGISGYEVRAECDLSAGLPAFEIVGLPDAAVKEARDRVRAAIKNCGFTFPVSRITVNLAPANQRKGGTVYDLPILAGILAAGGQLRLDGPDSAYVGELSLSGSLRPVVGMLPMALAARRAGIKRLYVPAPSRRRGHSGRRAGGLPGGERGAAGGPSEGGGPSGAGGGLDAGAGGLCLPRLCRREGAGKREARPGDRRRRRPQPLHGGPARIGQVHAGPPPALHPP